MKRIAFALFFLSASILSALDIKAGLVRVTSDDQTLFPVLYRLVSFSGKTKYEPLWSNEDPRTSFIALNVDGRIYRVGSSQEYKTSQRKIENGIEIEYRSITNRVTQRITMVALADSRVINGFTIAIEIENYTSRDMKIMIKQVCDTWLGEKSGNHFMLKSNPKLMEEIELDKSMSEPYIVSPGQDASIALLLDVPERPDSVIVANWKRLSDSKFFYDSDLMKGFTLAPYSVNDSALGLFWNERIVPAKRTMSVESQWLTGAAGDEFLRWLSDDYSSLKSREDQAQGFEVNESQITDSKQPAQSVDVRDIQSLYERIDSALQNIDTVTEEEIQAIVDEVTTLEKRTEPASKP